MFALTAEVARSAVKYTCMPAAYIASWRPLAGYVRRQWSVHVYKRTMAMCLPFKEIGVYVSPPTLQRLDHEP